MYSLAFVMFACIWATLFSVLLVSKCEGWVYVSRYLQRSLTKKDHKGILRASRKSSYVNLQTSGPTVAKRKGCLRGKMEFW